MQANLIPLTSNGRNSDDVVPCRRPYSAPVLSRYGDVRSLTQSGTTGPGENAAPNCVAGKKISAFTCPSDRRLKEDIVHIGDHPLGFGLYLFSFKPEYRDQYGSSKQFGVMADEVKAVVPLAVLTRNDGYLAVDYEMLGIRRSNH
jgi:hypothetical protein